MKKIKKVPIELTPRIVCEVNKEVLNDIKLCQEILAEIDRKIQNELEKSSNS